LTQSGLTDRRAIIITDANVAGLFLDEIKTLLVPHFSTVSHHIIPAGETSKNFTALQDILTAFQHAGLDRHSLVIALGGGVVGDLAGFAASIYMRGVAWANLPTTLLAQADSAVGGKTAIDFCGTKNLIGSFHQPALIYVNTAALATLPQDQYISGLAEVVKYGIIDDALFFDYLWYNRHHIADRNVQVLEHILHTSYKIKAKIVAQDEKDTGLRQVLNYGHTFGHAIESLTDFTLPHGHCVALGMICAAAYSRMDASQTGRIATLLDFFGLPTKLPAPYNFTADDVYKMMQQDKKATHGTITLIISHAIGSVEITHGAKESDILTTITAIL